MALQFEARKVAMKQDRNGFILTLSIHPDSIPEELFRDFVGARYACAMVRIQDDESPTVYKNRTQRAAIMCKQKDFQVFLGVDNEIDAADQVCIRCGIESRAELNGNRMAQAEFDKLVREFEDTNDPF
jgi:hypothetical protein